MGVVSAATAAALRARAAVVGTADNGSTDAVDTTTLRPTRLFAVNRLVDAENERGLAPLTGDAVMCVRLWWHRGVDVVGVSILFEVMRRVLSCGVASRHETIELLSQHSTRACVCVQICCGGVWRTGASGGPRPRLPRAAQPCAQGRRAGGPGQEPQRASGAALALVLLEERLFRLRAPAFARELRCSLGGVRFLCHIHRPAPNVCGRLTRVCCAGRVS